MKFTPANGRISLVITQSQGGKCIVQIRDTGVGIAPEHLPHLFGEFSKIPSSLPSGQGPQLGLFLVKSLRDQHQASITVESELGSGSTFTITFPTVIAKQ
jgi:two-component system sensor histidine kinase/response regulator